MLHSLRSIGLPSFARLRFVSKTRARRTFSANGTSREIVRAE